MEILTATATLAWSFAAGARRNQPKRPMAAAIAETGRGKTIGSKSYGKGVIQATIPLLDDTLLQMTIAKWRSPNGEWYHERGVSPQIEMSDDPATETDELLQTALEILSTK